MSVTAAFSATPVTGYPPLDVTFSSDHVLTGADVQTVQALNLTQVTSTTAIDWSSIASSIDGVKLVATAASGHIWLSTDSGLTWTQSPTSVNEQWTSVASSSNGEKLAAACKNYGSIYTSSDSGITWVECTMPNPGAGGEWYGVSTSGTGDFIVAVRFNGTICTSTDSGATWTEQSAAGSRAWTAVCVSKQIELIIATVNSGNVWTSTTQGSTWFERTGVGSGQRTGVACSGTGLIAITGIFDAYTAGYLYLSTTNGAPWTQLTSLGLSYWSSFAVSEDGLQIIAIGSDGATSKFATSIDSGTTWNVQTKPSGASELVAVTTSSDGSQTAVASRYGSGIYRSTYSTLLWTFGDGSPNKTNTPVVHRYSTAGVYQAKLSVGTTSGYIDSTNTAITVTAAQLFLTPLDNATRKKVSGITATTTSVFVGNDAEIWSPGTYIEIVNAGPSGHLVQVRPSITYVNGPIILNKLSAGVDILQPGEYARVSLVDIDTREWDMHIYPIVVPAVPAPSVNRYGVKLGFNNNMDSHTFDASYNTFDLQTELYSTTPPIITHTSNASSQPNGTVFTTADPGTYRITLVTDVTVDYGDPWPDDLLIGYGTKVIPQNPLQSNVITGKNSHHTRLSISQSQMPDAAMGMASNFLEQASPAEGTAGGKSTQRWTDVHILQAIVPAAEWSIYVFTDAYNSSTMMKANIVVDIEQLSSDVPPAW